jgi:hypothetical protein
MTSLSEAFSGRSLRSQDEFIDGRSRIRTISEPPNQRVGTGLHYDVPAEMVLVSDIPSGTVVQNVHEPPLPNNIVISSEDQQKITEKYQINNSELKSSILMLKHNYTEISMKRAKLVREKQDIEEKTSILNKKLKELIDLTDDASLKESLQTKMNEVHPRLQELNESLELIDKEFIILKYQYESLSEIFPRNVCGICYCSENNAFITGCGHSFCYDCCIKLTKCATCRVPITPGCIKKIFYN